VRVAILKYLRSSSRYKGPRGAVEGLVVNQLSPHVKKEVHAILDANRWRTDRMYLLEVRHPPSTQAKIGFQCVWWRAAERRHPTGRERMVYPTPQTLQDPISLLPWVCFRRGSFPNSNIHQPDSNW
jgi:hypothetical protein